MLLCQLRSPCTNCMYNPNTMDIWEIGEPRTMTHMTTVTLSGDNDNCKRVSIHMESNPLWKLAEVGANVFESMDPAIMRNS